ADGAVAALKLLKEALHPSAEARFVREQAALAGVDHPGVVRLLAGGEVDGVAYLATEYLGSRSLGAPPPDLDLAAVARQLAAGLDALHAAGLLHRDVKPANVVLAPDGRAVLIDLGMVLDPTVTALTSTGALVGTPSYLAPELWRGGEPTPASDQFAWGATCLRLLTGASPYGVEEVAGIVAGLEGYQP
ncbi:MAG: serine/threonine protein kinase, partial [Myxococcales bacterium]|nr:serine/threonine protein kinase [Myxococcales bacterium]